MKTISNTEITIYNTCQRQHYYRFRLAIQPRYSLQSVSLTRGTVGHLVLDEYYQLIKAGASHEEAVNSAIKVHESSVARIAQEYPEEFSLIKELAIIRTRLEEYFEIYQDEPFKVIETEKVYSTSVSSDITYALKLDLLVEMIKGPYRGDLIVVDHKWVYNFKTERELNLGVQLPKYIYTVRQNGYFVTKGIFNQIRYRHDAKTAFSRTTPPLKPNKAEISRIWDEQQKSALEIIELEKLSLEDHEKTVKRVSNELVCKHCVFADICAQDLRGEDTSKAIAINFEKNTYGYEKVA